MKYFQLDVVNTAYSIINYNISIPKCNYVKTSRRYIPNNNCFEKIMHIDNNDSQIDTKPIYEQLKQLDGWNNYTEIAIDGQNGTTKSSLAALLNRKYIKLNELCPDITCGSDYNHRPLKAFDYITYQLLVKSENTVWDRCIFSNMIFYYVHHLMYRFGDTPIPKDDAIIWPILNTMANDTCLLDTLKFVHTLKRVPTLFLVCSNVDLIGESLRIRGIKSKSWNDVWNSKEYNYQLGQYHVYRWFGKLLGSPVFDLVDFFKEQLSIDDMHLLIASKLNTRKDVESKIDLPDSKVFNEFNDIINTFNDDVLIYEYSKK